MSTLASRRSRNREVLHLLPTGEDDPLKDVCEEDLTSRAISDAEVQGALSSFKASVTEFLEMDERLLTAGGHCEGARFQSLIHVMSSTDSLSATFAKEPLTDMIVACNNIMKHTELLMAVRAIKRRFL